MIAGPRPPGGLPASGHVRVAVLGAGFGGLAVAHHLRRAGIDDFVVIDRGDTVGGTWRDNTYPGCGCDVASHLYSFSFAPNPEWSRSYSRQPEIHAYLQTVARDLDLERHLALGVEVLDSRWDDDTVTWAVATSRGTITADVVIGAAGPLSSPVSPSLPGLESFDGPVFHTARWRSDVDLRGRRVGVVGTGASAVQVVPEIQPVAGRLTVFQRTPPWVLPKGDRALSALEHRLYRAAPALTRVPRLGNYLFREATVPAFVLQPAIMRAAELASKQFIRRQIPDPELRRLVTPDYRLGCKRVLPANEYYPALQQVNVELVPHALTSFEGNTAIAADGSRHELDVVIFGTGFQVSDLPIAHHLFGRDGVRMSEKWAAEGRSALRLTTVAGFPNLFLVLGPSSGLGHSSMVHVIESQARYIVSAVTAMTAGRLAAVEPDPVAQARWNHTVQRRMRRTVWQTGGCVSWYQDPDGRNTTLWPASTLRLRHELRAVDLREYRLRAMDPAVARARATATDRPPSAGHGSLLLPPPAERRAVYSADGTALNVERWGPESGPTVVLAHGWTCSIAFWVRQINALAGAGYRVVAYDQRGHGDSGAPGPAGHTPEALADDFSAVLSAVTASADEQVLAAGHSMGAMTLIAFGARHPEQLRRQVAAAVLASTGMHELFLRSRIVPMPLPLARLALPISVALMGYSSPKGRAPWLNRQIVRYGSLSRAASRPDVDFCARVVEACPPRTRARFARMLSTLDLDAEVRGFTVPTAVVAGARDRLTPIWHARRLAATLPNLEEFRELPRSGHMTPVQSAAEVNDVLFRLAGAHLSRPGAIDVDLAAQERTAGRTQEIA